MVNARPRSLPRSHPRSLPRSTAIDRDAVLGAAGAVLDPELPALTLAMLGVLHDVEVDGADVTVTLLPTFVGCPATDMMAVDVRVAVAEVPGVDTVTVRFVYDPPWTPDRISDEGHEALRSFGIAPPPGRRGLPIVEVGTEPAPRPCPYCGSTATERDGIFGPTPCRDVRFCTACQQPFEAFRG